MYCICKYLILRTKGVFTCLIEETIIVLFYLCHGDRCKYSSATIARRVVEVVTFPSRSLVMRNHSLRTSCSNEHSL